MTKQLFIVLIFTGFLFSCKSTSVAVKTTVKPLSTAQILKNNFEANINASTINAKIKVKYIAAKKTRNITAKLRLKKDSTIWISLTAVGGIPVAKMLIKPKHVLYYEKLDKTYFDGDFSLLSKWLNTDLDFKKIQNLLFAEPVYPLSGKKLILAIINNSYQLKVKKKIAGKKVTFWVNSSNFKLNKQKFAKNKKEFLSFSYLGFDTSTPNFYPNKIQVVAQSKKEVIKINLIYKSLKFNKPISFPFKIPKGYKSIEIK
ncbi:MAG: DUF4292 domain-containing protein [Flavobacteriaceae bacterium]|nr:DUF4292 domain-containing protein [Flavobacteriaceae bacterium]